MSERNFQMRLICTYTGPNNAVDKLDVETLIEGEWKTLDLNIKTAGFQVFCYAVFTCQHMYFRLNAAERGLRLESSKASITVGTNNDWLIDVLHVEFNGKLRIGEATQDNVAYITERMALCPVSCNLSDVADNKTRVTFE